MRALRNAVLAYGLVNVPVGVCTATRKRTVSFKTLHLDCGGPVSQNHFCSSCGRTIGSSETTKGYEVTKGNIVPVDTDVLDEIGGSSSEVIEIEKFVPADQLEGLQVCDSYYLQPDQKHPYFVAGYAQLTRAMGQQVVGLGTSHLWAKEMPTAIWAKENGVLVLSRLYCYDEVIDSSEIAGMLDVEIPEKQMELADLFVATSMNDVDPELDLVSKQRNDTDNYLAALVAGQEYTVERVPAREISVRDMEEVLEMSIEAARS